MHFHSTWIEKQHASVYFIRPADPDHGDHRLAVGLASTVDGLHFMDLGVALKPGVAGAWDDRMASFPGVWKASNSSWKLVYEGSTDQPYETARWSTGLARSKDLLAWEKYSTPILPRTERGFSYDGSEWFRTPDGVLHLYFRTKQGATGRANLVQK